MRHVCALGRVDMSPAYRARESAAENRASTARALREEKLPRLFVLGDVDLARFLVAERNAALHRRPRRHPVEPAFEVRKLTRILPLALPGPRPAEARHVR